MMQLWQVSRHREVAQAGAAIECLPNCENLAIGLDKNRRDLIGAFKPGCQHSAGPKSIVESTVGIDPRHSKD